MPRRRHQRPSLVLLVALGLAACSASSNPASVASSSAAPSAGTTASPGVTPVAFTGRISPPAQAALIALAADSLPAVAERGADAQAAPTVTLDPDAQATFDAQLAEASGVASRLATPEAAAAAGYVQSATQLPAVGTHWVDWSLVDQPFDPAHPAMLLFDQAAGHETRLAGLSYWVRSVSAPDGFVGPNDHWHRHSGMCFEDGWLREEAVPTASQCGGQYLEGSDLWMLHVWVVPGYSNADGVFAARNTDLCPPDNAQLPDSLKCSAPGNPAAPGSHDDPTTVTPDASAYCHLPAT